MVVLVASKVEELVSVGPAAEQVTDVATVEQRNNIRLVNLLCSLGTQLGLACSRRLRNLPVFQSLSPEQEQSPFQILHAAFRDRLNPLCRSILDPLLQSIAGKVQDIIASMHDEDFGADCPTTPTGGASAVAATSQYMARLQVRPLVIGSNCVLYYCNDAVLGLVLLDELEGEWNS